MTAGERQLLQIATLQHGVLSLAQAHSAGLSAKNIYDRSTDGRWIRLSDSAFRIAGAPQTWKSELFAACLSCGQRVAVSFEAAAQLWGLDRGGSEKVVISIIAPRSIQSGTEVKHRMTDFEECDVVEIAGLPVTSPERTIIDLGWILHESALEIALDSALRKELTTPEKIYQRLTRIGSRGRKNAGKLKKMLEIRMFGTKLPESALERKVLEVIEAYELPIPELQYEIRASNTFVARVDFAYPSVKLVVEAASYEYHSGRIAWHNDQIRSQKLVALGWRVLTITWEDVRETPALVASHIREALGSEAA